jgi:hypothetical protein
VNRRRKERPGAFFFDAVFMTVTLDIGPELDGVALVGETVLTSAIRGSPN